MGYFKYIHTDDNNETQWNLIIIGYISVSKLVSCAVNFSYFLLFCPLPLLVEVVKIIEKFK